MKEIEFKGQPIGKRGRWQYGIGAYKSNTAEHLIINAKGESVEVIHLCQYTGLDDSKGKHIYDGDILFVQMLSARKLLFERLDHLQISKWVCYTMAFSGWGVATVLLIYLLII